MKTEPNQQFAVITGASQGLGKAFATELAKRQFNVVLVSLPGQRLSHLSDCISREFGVQSVYYETDLTSDCNIRALAKWLNENFNISILINNAGIGGTSPFEDAHIDYIDSIIQVNVKATALLTHQLLSNLKRQPQSYVLNVSSIAAYSPLGYKTVYPASKAFIHSFSCGLNAELKGTNVFVSVVNPGPMATNADVSSRIQNQGIIGKLTLLKPEKVAYYSINRLLKRNSVITVSPFLRIMSAILPMWISLPFLTQIAKKECYVPGICSSC